MRFILVTWTILMQGGFPLCSFGMNICHMCWSIISGKNPPYFGLCRWNKKIHQFHRSFIPIQVLYVPGSQFHVNFSTPEDVFWCSIFSEVSFLPFRWQVGHEHLQLSEPITGSVVFRCSEDFQREKPLGKPSWKWDENEHIYIYIHINI